MPIHDPSHPGSILKELVLDPLGLSVSTAASHLNVSRKTLSKIINERGAITPEMALRLELVFKEPSADHWLQLQTQYDLWQTRQHSEDIVVAPFAAHKSCKTERQSGKRA